MTFCFFPSALPAPSFNTPSIHVPGGIFAKEEEAETQFLSGKFRGTCFVLCYQKHSLPEITCNWQVIPRCRRQLVNGGCWLLRDISASSPDAIHPDRALGEWNTAWLCIVAPYEKKENRIYSNNKYSNNSDDEIKLKIEVFTCGCYMLITQQPHVSSGYCVGQHRYRWLSSFQNVLRDSTIIMG